MTEEESLDLRQAFGQFVTGVTIVTTSGPDSEPIGVTANSFSSVSLDPPMILWALAKTAMSRVIFEKAESFCVHVLTASQRELSERFACQGEDKFAGVKWLPGPGSVPWLDEYVARFHCATRHQHSVGDHLVIVGEVLQFERTTLRPLVFHGGQYALAERRIMEAAAREDAEAGTFLKNRRKSHE